jgi:hypothetical protein
VGVVYEAIDRDLDTRVAIKALRNPSAETIHILKREFRALQDLQHPNLISLGELFEEHGTWFFTMEFVPGVQLLRYVRPGSESRASFSPPPLVPAVSGKHQAADLGRLDEGRLRSALGQIARGLAALHAANKVHRDVKPSNILVTPEGRVVILDFGLVADALRDRGQNDPGIEGTVLYMAPEQAAGENVSFAADWYAVGVILFQALTGRLPFYGTAYEVLEDKLKRASLAPHDLVPSVPADLDQLCVDLLRTDPLQRPTGSQILARLHVEVEGNDLRSARTPIFVGREPEQRALRDAFDDVERGESVTVFVHGESGVGKSFLVRRFTDEIAREGPGTVVLAGRCYERESVAYKAVDGIIDALSEWLKDLPEAEVKEILPANVGLLERAFPVLGKVPSIAAAVEKRTLAASPQQLRAYTFSALRALFDAIARRHALVLAVDDLQWADHDSLVLLAEIMRPPSPPPLLLVATIRLATESHRPAGDAPAPRIGSDVRHLHLEHLSNEEAEKLVVGLLDRGPGDGELRAAVQSIVEDTKGHPLFIDEIVRQGAARLVEQRGSLRLDDALWTRIEHLDHEARRVVEAVATAGSPIPQRIIAMSAAIDMGDLFKTISHLRAAHLVRTSGVGHDDAIEPYHDRIRELVTARLDLACRKEWHGRLALALESWPDADPESLSNHWEGAGRRDRARQCALVAAERAEETLAFDLAARQYRRALDLGEGQEGRTTILERLAEALTNAGRWAEAAEVRLDLATRADTTTALDLRRRAAEQLMCSGHFDRGVGILRKALAECHVGDPRSSPALLIALVFFRLLLALRGLAYRERPAGDRDRGQLVRADTARSAGAGFSMTDNVRGAYFQTRNLLMTLRAGDPHRIARALCMEVCFSSAGGASKLPRTKRLLGVARALADRLGTGEALGMAATATGYMHYFVGEWGPCAEWLARAEEHFRDRCIGFTFELNSVRTMMYRALGYHGDLRELASRVTAAYREASQQGDLYTRINLRGGPLALVGLVHDEAERVRRELEEAIEWLPKTRFLVQHYFCWIARTQVELYEGNGVAAHHDSEATWPVLRRSLLLHVESIRIAGLEQRGRSALAAAASNPEAVAIAAKQAHALERIRLPWALGAAYLLRGGVAFARGDRAAALAHVDKAAQNYEAGEMRLHAAVARRRVGQLRGGDEGRAIVSESEWWMTDQGVRNPLKLARIIAPGFGEEAEAAKG